MGHKVWVVGVRDAWEVEILVVVGGVDVVPGILAEIVVVGVIVYEIVVVGITVGGVIMI